MARPSMSVPPMKRLIERGEFEKRLSDKDDGIVKAFRHLTEILSQQEVRIAKLEAER